MKMIKRKQTNFNDKKKDKHFHFIKIASCSLELFLIFGVKCFGYFERAVNGSSTII